MNSEQRASSQKVLSVIVIFTIALAAVAAFFSASKESKEYAISTPEGVVQRYLEAVLAGRNETAASYFATDSQCDATDIDRTWVSETVRVNLANVDLEGDKAFVEVVIDLSSGGPFDDYYTEKHNFRMSRESGGWKIMGIPWPLYSCEEPGK